MAEPRGSRWATDRPAALLLRLDRRPAAGYCLGMTATKKTTRNPASSYRFDPATLDLIGRVATHLGVSASDALRLGVRLLARRERIEPGDVGRKKNGK